MQSSCVFCAPCLKVLCAHLQQLNEPDDVHHKQQNKQQGEGNLAVVIFPLDITLEEHIVDRNRNDLCREYHQSVDKPYNHSGRVAHHNELGRLRIGHNSQRADKNIANIMDKKDENAYSQPINNEIRHENKSKGSEVVNRHENEIGTPRLHQSVHKGVDVVTQLEHVEFTHPWRNGCERVVLKNGETVTKARRPPLLAAEEVER